MRRLISAIFALSILLVISFTAFAAPIVITTREELEANSTTSGTTLTLAAQSLLIKGTSPIDLTAGGYAHPNLALSYSLTNLTVDGRNLAAGGYYNPNFMLKVTNLYI